MGGWVGWVGGGARGERAIPQKQGEHIQMVTTTRSLKTGGRKTVQGRRGAGEAVLNNKVGENRQARTGRREQVSENR